MEELGSFNKELTGTEVVVDGVLRERRLTRTEIDDMEKDVNKRMEDDEEEGAAEACQAELANINEMRRMDAGARERLLRHLLRRRTKLPQSGGIDF